MTGGRQAVVDAGTDVNLHIEGLTIAAGEHRILTVDDLSIERGHVVAFVGPSGSGKSTLLHAFAGHMAPGLRRVSGRIDVFGTDPFDLGARELRQFRRSRVAFVCQEPASRFQPRHRVAQILTEHRSGLRRADPEGVSRLLQRVHLHHADILHRRPGELSGGQLRRLALARALARDPDLLVLDEPTAGLDPVTSSAVLASLRELIGTSGTTVVLATHDVEVVAGFADRAITIERGRLRPDRGAVPEPARSAVLVPVCAGPHPAREDDPRRPVLEARHVRVQVGARRRPVTVVHGVDLDVAPGALLAVVGPSGSGKTSLLRHLAGLAAGDGKVTLDGVPLPGGHRAREPEQLRRIQYVPQDPLGSLNPSRTVGQTLARPLRRFRGLPRAAVGAAARSLLADVGLGAEMLGRRPGQLSGGQRQRVALARALAAEPVLLLCDEITSALDPATADAVLTTLRRTQEDRWFATILVTHDHVLASRFGDQVVWLDDGRLVASPPVPLS